MTTSIEALTRGLAALSLCLSLGCGASPTQAGTPGAAPCGPLTDLPGYPPSPRWSYQDQSAWGDKPGYELCGSGTEQSPVVIDDEAAVRSKKPLVFRGYDQAVRLDLANNGHAILVNVTGSRSRSRSRSTADADPRIEYDGTTYYLVEVHWHSGREHVIGPNEQPFEAHFVHEASDGAKAVVGVLFDRGEASAILDEVMAKMPPEGKRQVCPGQVRLDTLLPGPAQHAFYTYPGSLTVPPCKEKVRWFVLTDTMKASAAQAERYQRAFHGPTHRRPQDLHHRLVEKFVP